ncbi:hypothetical protein JCM6882_008968 [Rhodosporidiobolus microsporus]
MADKSQHIASATTTIVEMPDEDASSTKSDKLDAPSPPPPPYSIYTPLQKWAIVSLVMVAGIFSPITANSYMPAIPAVAESLGVTIQKINLSVTVFMILQAVTPTIWGSLCDSVGRRPVYLACLLIYIGSSLGLAFTETYAGLMVLRCVQAAGSASVVALGSGTIGDLAPPKERGGYMGIYSLGAMLGPCIGPLAGGLLADRWDWHAIFFFLTAFSGIVFVLMVVCLPETLRSVVGNGSIQPTSFINRSVLSIFLSRRKSSSSDLAAAEASLAPPKRRSFNPFASLVMFREKDVALILAWNSVLYSLFYAIITSTSSSLKDKYNLSESALGLCYLSVGGGMIAASACNGPRLNRDYRLVARRHEEKKAAERAEAGEKEKVVPQDHNDLTGFPIESARLRSLPYAIVLMLVVTIIYGWTVEKQVHLAVPLICQFGAGFASMIQFTSISTLLVDLFPGASASATAANNLARCLLGAGATAVIDPIIAKMGVGWAFTMLSLICVIFLPTLVLEWFYGQKFRQDRADRQAKAKREKEARQKDVV